MLVWAIAAHGTGHGAAGWFRYSTLVRIVALAMLQRFHSQSKLRLLMLEYLMGRSDLLAE